MADDILCQNCKCPLSDHSLDMIQFCDREIAETIQEEAIDEFREGWD